MDVFLIVEEAVEFDDVGMVEVHLDLYLTNEGDLEVLLFDDPLGDGFYGADETSGTVASKDDLAVLAAADLFAQLEMFKCQ